MPCRTLSDVRQRGFLDLVDFTVAMYLIQALMTGKLSTVPVSLPHHIYDEAARFAPPPSSSQLNLPAKPPAHPSRSSIAKPVFDQPPPRHPAARTPSQPSSPGWEISPATRIQADHVFSTLDPRNRGRVKGEAVRGYLHTSGMSSHTADRIW